MFIPNPNPPLCPARRSPSSATCRARAPAEALSATTIGLLLLATTTRCSRPRRSPEARRDLPATVVGKPGRKILIGDLRRNLLARLFPLVMPGVVGLWSYGETGHSLAAAGSSASGTARGHGLASHPREGQLSLTSSCCPRPPGHLGTSRRRSSTFLERTNPETDLYVFSNLAMDTLDYTGPAVNGGLEGVWLGLGDPVRALPASSGRRRPRPPRYRRERLLRGLPGGGRAGQRRRIPVRGLDSPRHAGLRRLAARRPDRRPATCFGEPDELPLDDVHPLRARARHPRRVDAGASAITWSTSHRCSSSAPQSLPSEEVSCDPRHAASCRVAGRILPGGGREMGDSERAHLTLCVGGAPSAARRPDYGRPSAGSSAVHPRSLQGVAGIRSAPAEPERAAEDRELMGRLNRPLAGAPSGAVQSGRHPAGARASSTAA